MATQYNPFPDKNKQGAPGVIEIWGIERLKPNPLNPRGNLVPEDPAIMELANSIRSQGLIQPFTVTPKGFIVAGHRRHLACVIVGVARVRVIVQNLTEQQQLEIMVVENIQRQDLSPYHEAVAYQNLIDTGLAQTEVARRVGVAPAHIQARRKILKLCPEVQNLYKTGEMPTAIIPHLALVTNHERQMRYAIMASRRALPLARLEKLIESSEQVQKNQALSSAHQRPVLTGFERKTAVALLIKQPQKTISFADLSVVLEQQCCACGLRDYSANTEMSICTSCPLPQLIKAIAEHANAKS